MIKIDLLKKSIKNPAVHYLVSRYGIYGIQFFNSIFIALYLGPYYLGIWGFIGLVIGYITQLNFGISHAMNVSVSVEKKNEKYVREVIGNSLLLIGILVSLVIFFFIMVNLDLISIGEKFNFSHYMLPVVVVTVIAHFNSVFANIFRIYGKLNAIIVNQSLYPLMVLCILPFFRKEELLWAMLYANAAAFIISFVQFIIKSPVKLQMIFDRETARFLMQKGWLLFIYNTSFYLIILSTNSFISAYYKVEEFGFYTFSYSLANVVLLLLNSISFLIFPKLLNRFATLESSQIQKMLSDVRAAYISLSHLLIHSVILFFPLFLILFPTYSSAGQSFKMVALTVVLYCNSFGYQGVLMARRKEKTLAKIAISALLLNIIISAGLVYLIKVPFSMVIMATLLTYILYVYVVGVVGRKVLNLNIGFIQSLKDIYPWRMMLPFFVSLLLTVAQVSDWYFALPLFLFLILNFSDMKKVKSIAFRIIRNPNIINI